MKGCEGTGYGHTVARLKRDVLSKSNVGVLFGSKEKAGEHSRIAGLDIGMRPGDVVFLNGQFAGSWQNGQTDDNTAITADLSCGTDLSDIGLSYRRIAPDFEIDETGFLRKEPFRGNESARINLGFSPRPRSSPIRKVCPVGVTASVPSSPHDICPIRSTDTRERPYIPISSRKSVASAEVVR